MAEPQLLFDYTGHLPECPTWSEEEQALWWADILEGELHRYHPATGEHSVLCFPEEVGCFALREKGGFIVAMRNAIWLADKRGLLVQKVCDNPSNPQLARFNDGGTDHLGRFYAGTFWGPGDYNGALLMRIDNDLKPRVIQCDIQGHNGLAFSHDKQWMFTSDTPNGVIYRTPLDEQGSLVCAKSSGDFKSVKVSRTVRQWMLKAATGAQCSMAGVLHGFHRRESNWQSIACRCVARQWSALAEPI
jgi:sugar lactone lactonase YvrE